MINYNLSPKPGQDLAYLLAEQDSIISAINKLAAELDVVHALGKHICGFPYFAPKHPNYGAFHQGRLKVEQDKVVDVSGNTVVTISRSTLPAVVQEGIFARQDNGTYAIAKEDHDPQEGDIMVEAEKQCVFSRRYGWIVKN